MLVLAAVLSLAIGVSLGLLGGGGSILTLPMLVWVLHVEPKAAIATSLFVVGITSFVSMIAHMREGRVKPRVGLPFGLAGMAGAYAGGRVAKFLPGWLLLLGFGAMMLATSIAMLRGRKEVEASPRPLQIGRTVALGTSVGVISGLVGAGGGFLVVPALSIVGGLPMIEAVATSLLVISMQSLAGFVGNMSHVVLQPLLMGVVTSSAVLGSLAGVRIARHVPAKNLRRSFGWLVLAMGLFVVGRQLPVASIARTISAVISQGPAGGIVHPSAMQHFTPVASLVGGMLIGLGAAILLLTHGRVAGISGILGSLLKPRSTEPRGYRVAFLVGLLGAGIVMRFLRPSGFEAPSVGTAAVIAAGVLVGFGTRLGNGCTSGHGVCGTSRLSPRSIAATITFMATGAATVFVVRHLLGGAS